jgi:Domain of unknown function (DUF4345)
LLTPGALPRTLRVLIGVIAVVPLATGVLGIVGGLTIGPDGEAARYFDSEYRFLNAVWLVAGLALWWSLRRPAERALVTRVVLAGTVLGGLSRLLSVAVVGWPPVEFRAAMAIELLVIPALLVWHVRALGRHRPGPLG